MALFGLACLPGFAAERITVQQLERMIAEGVRAQAPAQEKDASGVDHKLLDELVREDALAPRLEKTELSERLTPSTRARLVTSYKLGPLTESALELLADRSALLDPPAGEFPQLPPPGPEEQRRMIAEAELYVDNTLLHLPDFFATRATTRFDDAFLYLGSFRPSTDDALQRVDADTRQITFRDGKETVDAPNAAAEPTSTSSPGLESHGEFGSEAAIVLLDAGRGPLTFDHWEHTAQGRVAVFHYAVPSAVSHYEVDYSCGAHQPMHLRPAYHGSIAINPVTNRLVRLTLEAELPSDAPLSQVASVLEYEPVVLGSRRFLCPARSLTFVTQNENACAGKQRDRKLDKPIHRMNRTVFSHYRRLGSEARIVSGSERTSETDAQAPPESAEKSAATSASPHP